jgi:hypothetical protein
VTDPGAGRMIAFVGMHLGIDNLHIRSSRQPIPSAWLLRGPPSHVLAEPARTSLQTYVGHSVSELVSRFGLPKGSVGVGGGKMAFQWDRSVLGQSLAAIQDTECRLDTIIAIARPMHPRAAPSSLGRWEELHRRPVSFQPPRSLTSSATPQV